jgi:hypothetical protein
VKTAGFSGGIDNPLLWCIPLNVGSRKRLIMGFFSFFKNLFAGDDTDEEALDAARARHGIVLTKEERAEAKNHTTEAERFAKEYDVWEQIDQYRWTFLVGGWVAKKIHPIGEDKVKRDLERLEKKRREEEARKNREG